jgi:hypothetical protein
MAEETETFAFQAEINQLLSLIINVRGSFLTKLLSFSSSSSLFFRARSFLGIIFIRCGDERFFFSLSRAR